MVGQWLFFSTVSHPLTVDFDASAQERLFDVDYVDNVTGLAPGGDGVDGSGANFVNLPNMMTTRDNVYQSIADLFLLAKSLSVSGAGTEAPTEVEDAGQASAPPALTGIGLDAFFIIRNLNT